MKQLLPTVWPVDLSQASKGRKHLAEQEGRAMAKYSGICGSSCNILLSASFHAAKQ